MTPLSLSSSLCLLLCFSACTGDIDGPGAWRAERDEVAPFSGGNTIVRGGSNYAWYHLNSCDRAPYGIIYNYHAVRSTVHSQLQTMYSNGQRRLRIPIYHCQGCANGTVMDSSGGNLSVQHRTNLADLLADVRAAGFVEIMVSFHPQGANVPSTWSSWNEKLFQQNWNLIVNLRPIIAGAGIQYRIDLMNEGTPKSSQTQAREYCKRLWANYEHVYGKDDTVGFSIPPGADLNELKERIQQIPQIYDGRYPYLYALNFYNSACQTFKTAHQAMQSLPLSQTQGWIISESYYNDAPTAQALMKAITETGRTVYYLTQWPITTSWGCPDVDVAPPAEIDNYVSAGFGAGSGSSGGAGSPPSSSSSPSSPSSSSPSSPSSPPSSPSSPSSSPAAGASGAPVVSGAGFGCSDGKCLWVQGQGLGGTATLDVRRDCGGSIVDSYTAAEINHVSATVLTVRLHQATLDLLASAGYFHVWVRNSATSWSSCFRVSSSP